MSIVHGNTHLELGAALVVLVLSVPELVYVAGQ